MFSPRVVMLSYHTCPLASQEGKETGGMNVYVLELSKELARTGVKVDVYTRSQDLHNPEIVEVSENFRVIHLPAGPQMGIPKKELLQYVDAFAESYIEFTKQHQLSYDIMYAHYYMSGLAGEAIQHRLSKHVPMVMTFHTLALMKNLVARTELEKEGRERIDAEFHLTKSADHIITPSESDRSYLEYLYNVPLTKVSVIPPGVDTTLFQPINKKIAKQVIGASEDDKVIVFAGRIEPLKGIDVLMYAMKILISRRPDLPVALWIVGGDISQKPELWSKELQKLEELRQVLQIPTLVKFVGQQPQTQLTYYFNAAEAVVMPSHYESFGMAAAEAMACGVPVITTNVAGISSLIDEKHKSLIATVNNPLLLATQIEHVLTNEQTRAEVSQKLFEKVQDLAWHHMAHKVIHTFHKVLTEK